MLPIRFALRTLYSFFSALAQVLYRVVRWCILSLLKALIRVLHAFLRVGWAMHSLLLLPVYDYAVYWFNTYHPILALVGRSGIAFLRVGRTTGWAISRALVRLAGAFLAVVRFLGHALIIFLTTVWLLVLVPTRFIFKLGLTFLSRLYKGFVTALSLIRKLMIALGKRVRRAVRAVWHVVLLLVVPVLMVMGRTLKKLLRLGATVVGSFLRALGRVVLFVLRNLRRIVVFTAALFLATVKILGHIISTTARMCYRILSKILRTTAQFLLRVVHFLLAAARFLYHALTAPIKRTGIAFSRSIVSLVALVVVLCSIFSLTLLKVSVPLAFFLSRNYLAWHRILYTLTYHIAKVIIIASHVLLGGVNLLRQNSRIIGEMTGIFSPTLGGVLWYLFTGSMLSLIAAGGYFILITVSSYLYNRWKQGDVNV